MIITKWKCAKSYLQKKILLIYVPLQNSLGMLQVYKKLGKNKSFGYLFFISRLADFIVLWFFLVVTLHTAQHQCNGRENVYLGKKRGKSVKTNYYLSNYCAYYNFFLFLYKMVDDCRLYIGCVMSNNTNIFFSLQTLRELDC